MAAKTAEKFSSYLLTSERELAQEVTTSLLTKGSIVINIFFLSQLLFLTGKVTQNHADAAHNVFLDFTSFGGLLLLGSFTLILLLIFITSLRAYKVMQSVDKTWAILFCLFVALQAENLISINYLPLATWEFVISGALYGYSRQIINTHAQSQAGVRA